MYLIPDIDPFAASATELFAALGADLFAVQDSDLFAALGTELCRAWLFKRPIVVLIVDLAREGFYQMMPMTERRLLDFGGAELTMDDLFVI